MQQPIPDGPLFPLASDDIIAAIGDSLTAGTAGTGYYLPLQAHLAALGLNVTWRNAGVGGNTTAQMLARVATDVINVSPQPTVVWIQGGINDETVPVAISVTVANVLAIAQACRAGIPGVRVAFIGMFSFGESAESGAVWHGSRQRDNQIHAMCAANKIAFFDIRSAFDEWERLNNWPVGNVDHGLLTNEPSSPGLHPNAQGAQLTSVKIWSQLQVLGLARPQRPASGLLTF